MTGLLDGSNNTALGSFLQSNFFSNDILNGTIAGGPFNPQSIIGTAVGAMGTRATTLSGLGDFAMNAEGGGMAALASDTVPSAGTGWRICWGGQRTSGGFDVGAPELGVGGQYHPRSNGGAGEWSE